VRMSSKQNTKVYCPSCGTRFSSKNRGDLCKACRKAEKAKADAVHAKYVETLRLKRAGVIPSDPFSVFENRLMPHPRSASCTCEDFSFD
jgi:hypothetical protein